MKNTRNKIFQLTALCLILSPIFGSPVKAQTQDPGEDNLLDTTDLELEGDPNDLTEIVDDPDVSEDISAGVDDQLDEINETLDETTDEVDETIEDTVDEELGDLGDLGDLEDLGLGDILGDFNLEDALGGILDIFGQLGIPDVEDILGTVNGSLEGGGDESGGGGVDDGEDNPGGGVGSDSTGDLGIPDPETVVAEIESAQTNPAEEILATKQGGNEGSPLVKDNAEYTFDIELGRETAQASALSEEAQSTLADNSQVAVTAMSQSQELASDSETQDVTQNIMRNLSSQAAARQQTDSLLALDAQARKRDDAIRNQLTAAALEQLQRDRTSQRRTDAAAYSEAINQGAQFTLPGFYSPDADDTEEEDE